MTRTDGKDDVLYDVEDHVATITLNRPERLNAFVFEMRMHFFELLRRADANEDVRVIVITGAGPGFCAGLDRDELADITGEKVRALEADSSASQLRMLAHVTKPTIAAVNGSCAGLGFCLALLTDIRIVAAGAKITASFSRLGLPAESGASWLLPRLVGRGGALDLLYSSRVISGDEAQAMGWAQYSYPSSTFAAESRAYALELADRSAHSLALMRKQVDEDDSRSFDDACRAAADLTADCVDRPELKARLAQGPIGR